MSYAWREHCETKNIDGNDRIALKAFYREKHKTELNEDGSIKRLTEQCYKDQCDINTIIAKYPQRVIASKMTEDEAQFADVTGYDFQVALNTVRETEANFMKLPPDVRAKFQNNPANYLNYLSQPTKAADTINDVYENPSKTKSKNAQSMKDTDKDGIPDKLENPKKDPK